MTDDTLIRTPCNDDTITGKCYFGDTTTSGRHYLGCDPLSLVCPRPHAAAAHHRCSMHDRGVFYLPHARRHSRILERHVPHFAERSFNELLEGMQNTVSPYLVSLVEYLDRDLCNSLVVCQHCGELPEAHACPHLLPSFWPYHRQLLPPA
jgi:hypothetical protein